MTTVKEGSKTVRLTPDVMKELAKRRKGWETPNDCLRRLFKV